MKKLKLLSLLITVGVVFIPLIVKAEVIKVDDKVYVIESVGMYTCDGDDSLNWSLYSKEGDNIIINAPERGLVHYNDGQCTPLTNQEMLDIFNKVYSYYSAEYSTFNFPRIIMQPVVTKITKKIRVCSSNAKYYLTEDTIALANKEYYSRQINENNNYSYVLENVEVGDSVVGLYGKSYFTSPANATYDANEEYYIYSDSESMIKVSEFNEDNILEYCVKTMTPDYLEEEEAGIVDTDAIKAKLEEFADTNEAPENGKAYDVYFNGNEAKVISLLLYDTPSHSEPGPIIKWYDTKFNEIFKDIGNIYNAQALDDFIIANSDTEMKIFDYKSNLIKSFGPRLREQGGISIVRENDTIYFAENDCSIDYCEDIRKSYYSIKTYKVLEGNNQAFENSDLSFRFKGEVEELDKVFVNETEVSDDNYTVATGSTVITLKDDYLKTLKSGNYSIKATYLDGGYVSASFVVPSANPKTSDNIYTHVLICLFGIVLSGYVLLAKKSVK